MLINQQQNTVPRTPWNILCDFDGTVSLKDTTDFLLENFAQEGWQEIEQQWEKGLIGSKQCMQQQIALLKMTQQQFYQCLDQIEIDQGFLELVKLSTQYEIPLIIVSDGLDLVIQYILSKYKLSHLPIVANQLIQTDEDQWRLDFPNTNSSCISASGTCKCKVAQQYQPEHIILIGDGRSDFCLSEVADYVFAKKSLIEHCREKQILHSPFEQFSEIQRPLEKLLVGDFAINHNMMVIE